MNKKTARSAIIIISMILMLAIDRSAAPAAERTAPVEPVSRLGIKLGTGWLMTDAGDNHFTGFSKLSLGIYYSDRLLDIDAGTNATQSAVQLYSITAAVSLFRYIGIGCGYMYIDDQLSRERKDKLPDHYRGRFHSLLGGILIKPAAWFRLGLWYGFNLHGSIRHRYTANNTDGTDNYRMDTRFSSDHPSLMISGEYLFNNHISLTLYFHQTGGSGSSSTAGRETLAIESRILTAAMGYALVW